MGKDNKYYFVAEYYPSGNIRGQYEENVYQVNQEVIKEQKPALSTKVSEVSQTLSTASQTLNSTFLNDTSKSTTNVKIADDVTGVLEFDDKNVNLKNRITEAISATSVNMTTTAIRQKKIKLLKNKIKQSSTTVSPIVVSKES